MDTPQAVQATAQAVAQELDRILVDTVAEIFNMEQVETTAAVTRASRSTSPANEPLATQPSPRNVEEAAVEAAADLEESRDCQDDPILPPIEDPTEEELAMVFEHSSPHGGATPLTVRPPSPTSSEASHSSLSSDGYVMAGRTTEAAIGALAPAAPDEDDDSTEGSA